jgi:hypothetical protein
MWLDSVIRRHFIPRYYSAKTYLVLKLTFFDGFYMVSTAGTLTRIA